MSTTETPRSSWIQSVEYRPGVLRFNKADGEAMVFRNVPSWLKGLVLAHKSPGRAFNLLVKGKYEYEKVEAPAPPEMDLEALLRASLETRR